jgi:uncharacterized protein (DUF427 family)
LTGKVNPDGAWFYPEPKAAAAQIRDYVAFWHGVKVGEVTTGAGSEEPVRSALRRLLERIAS